MAATAFPIRNQSSLIGKNEIPRPLEQTHAVADVPARQSGQSRPAERFVQQDLRRQGGRQLGCCEDTRRIRVRAADSDP